MTYDLLIIGGGVNGCAIAREAALNGWRVLLVEKDDLASHTSSASTKLIHGGLRYLETYEFGMVRHALQERALLLGVAPHIIRPIRFVLPHMNAIRPWWLVRAGLVIYDFLGGWPKLPMSRRLKRSDAQYQAPFHTVMPGFVYSDCAVDDSRLTILNAVDAASAGADIRTRTAFLSARPQSGGWVATLLDGSTVQAAAIVNAAGPWVSQVEGLAGRTHAKPMKLVRGSHIVVPKLYDGDHGYMLQQADKRIVFVINWVHNTTMIGTTEVDVASPEEARIDADETAYLLRCANAAFAGDLTETHIIYRWGGIRPLVDNGKANTRQTTRDFVLEVETADAPSLTVYGGKITTARYLAEAAIRKLAPVLGKPARPVTRDRFFPHGAMAVAGGDDFGHGLSRAQVNHMVAHEWARTADDILWRRTKLGLVFDGSQVAGLTSYLDKHFPHPSHSREGGNPFAPASQDEAATSGLSS